MAMAATHEKILVQGPIRFQHISALSFNVQSNQHGHMSIKGYFCPESAQNDSVQELTGRDFCLFAPKDEESNKLHPIFSGTVETSCVGRIGDVYVANMNLIGATSQLDIEPKSRSFQNVDMSYRQVVEDVLSYTPNASADFNAIADQPIKKTLIQYEETDWAFIKRLASMLGISLMADVTTPFPRFSFGQTDLAQADLSANEYTILMDQRFYNLGSTEAGQYKPDFLCYMVPSLQYYPPGSKVLYDGQSLVVCEVNGTLIDSELLYTYKVGHSGWLGQRELKNQKLIGLSLQGTVTETQREIVRIKLDIDKGRNAGFYPFSWIPESGNLMYCMPKKGTRATLYLPSTDTGEAVVITSPRTNGDYCEEMSDPQMRCFTTEHGKKMCLYPTQMIFSGGAPNETLQIQMDQLNYMLMGSTRPIQIVARLNIDIKAPAVTLSTPQEVQTGRSSVHAQAKVGLIIPKGTGGGNPPTGGGDTFFIMQFQFDALGEQGILLGLDPQPHDRFNDEPEALRNWGKLLLNFIIGAVVTVALVGLAVATGGIAGMALAALAVGTAAKTVQMTLVDGYTKSNRSPWGAIDFILRGSVIDSREALRSMWADIGNGARELAEQFTDKCTEISHGIVDVTGSAAHNLLNRVGLSTNGLDAICRGLHWLIDVDNSLSHRNIDKIANRIESEFVLNNEIEDGLIQFFKGAERAGDRLFNATGMALQNLVTSDNIIDFFANIPDGITDIIQAAYAGSQDIFGGMDNPELMQPSIETQGEFTVGKQDLDSVRNRIGVPETQTIAVGKTDVKGLENLVFEGYSPAVRKEVGLPDIDTIWPDRDIRAPAVNPLFTRHAEEVLANEFDRAVEEAGILPENVVGVLKIHQSNPRGVCRKCIQGLANDNVRPGILKQLSLKYPSLRIEVTSETLPDVKVSGRSSFVIQNGKYIN